MTGPGSLSDAVPPSPLPARGLPAWTTCVALAAVVRGAAVLIIPVLPEEAYHWLYSKHAALSYYDHPPLVAWLIGLGTLLFGDTALGIRFFPWLCSIGTAAAASMTARRLYGPQAASWTALLLAVQPATFFASSFGFPDAGMIFFWSLGLACVVQAFESGKGAWWLAAGAALGAGMLSKYTAAFLGASLLLYLLLTPKHRFWLATVWPYLGAVAALLVFSPVIVWNATHDWASFRFQSVGRIQEGHSPRATSALAYVGLQLASIVPLTWPVAIVAIIDAFRSRTPTQLFLLCLSLPLLAFFFCVGTVRSTHAFWPLPAWIALSILMAGALSRSSGTIAAVYRKAWPAVTAITLACVGVAVLHSVKTLPVLPPVPSMRGWTDISARAAGMRARLPEGSFYLGVGRRYLCASQLAFHLPTPREVHSKNLLDEEGLQFTYWDSPEALRGRDAVIVAEADWSPDLEPLLKKYFESVTLDGAPLSVGRLGSREGGKEERYVFYVGHSYHPRQRP
jgi:dolichol-phosphate mannosyltransferase